MHRDVADLHAVVLDAHARSDALHAVVDHDVAVGTRRRDSRRAGLDQFPGAGVVDLGPDRLFHPHARASRAAAHALRAVALGLDDLDAPERADDTPWGEVDVVVATEVARVVVHDAFVE